MGWLIAIIAIGTAIGKEIVGKLAEYTIEPVIRQVGYVFSYSDNLKKFRNQVVDLGDAKQKVDHAVQTEKDKGKRIENDVQTWLTRVDEITERSNNFLSDEHQAKIKCLHGFCPNLKNRHQLSRKSTKLAKEVAELRGKDFSSFGYEVKPEEVFNISSKDNQAFASRISVVNDILEELRKSSINMIGVYGIGGVGKTTLVKEVYRQVTDEKLFDDVIIILDVKQNPSIERIQKEIAESLRLDHRENETEAGRARRIADRMKGKKTLVIFDDVWETIELEAAGLSGMTTLTILFTSRSRKVLSSYMGTQKEFRLEVLGEEESWSLFEKTAGDFVKDPTIRTVATKIMQKCGGLPLLVVTVARGLKNSSLPEWRDALRRIEKLDGQELTDKAYSAIEWSYSELKNQDLRSLFLLCASAFGSGNSDDILYLLKYSMGLGLIKDVDTMEEAGDALHSMLKKLEHSCLLLENNDDNSRFRMHDLVVDVAKRIASRDHHILSCAPGNKLKEWPNDEFCKKCTLISLYCNPPEFPEVLQCPELTMFLVSRSTEDSSQEIPCHFFIEMRKLRVLDLTSFSLPSLPSSLEFLKDLRTLCLDQCTLRDISLVGQLQNLEILSFLMSNFEVLPKEIGQLTRLRLLNLTGCSQLRVISPNVLSSLNRLQHLKMGDSFNRWEAEGVINSKRSNANLEELRHLSQLTLLEIHIPDANTLPADLFSEKLERFQICIGSAWKWTDVDQNLKTLKLKLTTDNELDRGLKLLLKKTEDLYLEGTEGVNSSILYQLQTEDFQRLKHLHFQNNADFGFINNEKGNFPNLTWLAVSELNSSRFLLSSSMARSLANLKRLQISRCQIMEEIVSMDEENTDMFCQLQVLELKDLPNLTKFYSRCYTELPNPSIERLQSENISSRRNIEIVIQHFLLDNKLELLNLKELLIDGLPKLTSLWTNHFSPSSSNTLEKVEIVSCEKLKSIFPVEVASSLQQLRKLIVMNCGVEEIVSNTDGTQTAPVFDFPKLTYVRIEMLPRLRSFYPGLHTSNWPSLVSLMVHNCDNVRIFKDGKHGLNNLYTPNEQSLFSFEKDSFPNLEYLDLKEFPKRIKRNISYTGRVSELEGVVD